METQLGRRVRRLRQQAGLSATALAGDALSVATISRIEHGSIEPSLGTLRYLADRLGCTLADLLTEDEDAAALVAALEEVETWFLLGRPDAALACATTAQEANAGAATGTPSPAGQQLQRLRWAVLRAQALLDAAVAPALDVPISQARRGGDVWALARLVAVRVATLDAEAALTLLYTALRLLPPVGGDSTGHQLCRAELSVLLGQRLEAAGEVETARGLYTAAASLADLFRQPATWAQTFLQSPDRSTLPPVGGEPVRPPGMRRTGALAVWASPMGNSPPAELPDAPLSPGFSLAAVAAGTRLWRTATVDLARLDLQAHRLQDAARRLRGVYAGATGSTELTVLGAFWSELDRVVASRRGAAGIAGRALWLPVVSPATADELARLDAAAQAGRPAEAEQIGALLAASLDKEEAPLVQAIWLYLALGWAEAGNAPRAARALRAAQYGLDWPPGLSTP